MSLQLHSHNHHFLLFWDPLYTFLGTNWRLRNSMRWMDLEAIGDSCWQILHQNLLVPAKSLFSLILLPTRFFGWPISTSFPLWYCRIDTGKSLFCSNNLSLWSEWAWNPCPHFLPLSHLWPHIPYLLTLALSIKFIPCWARCWIPSFAGSELTLTENGSVFISCYLSVYYTSHGLQKSQTSPRPSSDLEAKIPTQLPCF